MNQTLAIFVDAYRELNARKMFWVTLILSGILFAGLAMFGADDNNFTFLWSSWPVPMAKMIYKKYLLDTILVGFWMSWGAVILALISTSFIFPEFVSGGTIDLYLSKPIGRLRLFLTKYVAGLLFVVLQSTVFAVCAFLVVGLRVGEWRTGLFLSIPLLTILFSYLYAVSVLIGVWTRSTIAAVTLTIVFWLVVFGIHFAESTMSAVLISGKAQTQVHTEVAGRLDARLKTMPPTPDRRTGPSTGPADGMTPATASAATADAAAGTDPATEPSGPRSARTRRGFGHQVFTTSDGPATAEQVRQRRDEHLEQVKFGQRMESGLSRWYTAAFVLKSVFPKTSDTIGMMDRALYTEQEWEDRNTAAEILGRRQDREVQSADPDMDPMVVQGKVEKASFDLQEQQRKDRGIAWTIGTSLAFEAVVLGLAAWIFYEETTDARADAGA